MKKILSLGLILAMLLVLVGLPLKPQVAEAGLTNVSATLSRLAVGATANHTIDFTMVTAATEGQTIVVQWDPLTHAFSLGALAFADITFTGATLLAACTATVADEVTVAIVTDATGDTATFTVCPGDTVAAGGKSIVFGGDIITNPGVAGPYDITIGGTMADSGSVAVTILADDRVAVTAEVAAVLTFAISDLTIAFGPLNPLASRWADGVATGSGTAVSAHNFTVSTNASAGYTVTIAGTTLGIAGTLYTIDAIGAAAVAPTIGSEQFGIRITATGGVGAVTAPYNVAGQYAFDTLAFPDEVASATAPSLITTFAVYYLANISAITEAGAYTTALTYVATGRF